MSEFDRVRALLGRAARDGTTPSRRVDYATAPAGLARLLVELDSAVLGQRLRFDFDNGAHLVCEVSARRLLHVPDAARRGLGPAQAMLIGRGGLAAEDAGALAGLLAALCEGATGFAVTAEPLDGTADGAGGGVDPRAIAEAAGLPAPPLRDAVAGAPHEAFLDALRPTLQAALLIEGDETSLILGGGAEADLVAGWAERSLERLLSPGFGLLGTLETNGLLVFALPAPEGRHLIVAGRRGSFLVATVKGNDVAATLDLWRACTAGIAG